MLAKELGRPDPLPGDVTSLPTTTYEKPHQVHPCVSIVLLGRALRQVEERANSKPALYVDGQDLCITCNVSGTDMSTR